MLQKMLKLENANRLSISDLKSINGGEDYDYNFCTDDLKEARADCHRYVDQPGNPFLG